MPLYLQAELNQYYLSFIHYRFNSAIDESICVGMILIDTKSGECKAKLSDMKMKIAKRILPNKNVFKAFKWSVEKLVIYDKMTYEYLSRLHVYQNGLIRITNPSPTACTMDKFDDIFDAMIEKPFKSE
jgi:hypothetical protein